MAKDKKKEEMVKATAMNIQEAKRQLTRTKNMIQGNLGPDPEEDIDKFKELFSEHMEETIHSLDITLESLNGKDNDVKLDAVILQDEIYPLKNLGEFLFYLKQTTSQDLSFEAPHVLIDSIFHLTKYQITHYNEIVYRLNSLFSGLELGTIKED